MLRLIIQHCVERSKQGDHAYALPAYSVEQLEDAIVQLHHQKAKFIEHVVRDFSTRSDNPNHAIPDLSILRE